MSSKPPPVAPVFAQKSNIIRFGDALTDLEKTTYGESVGIGQLESLLRKMHLHNRFDLINVILARAAAAGHRVPGNEIFATGVRGQIGAPQPPALRRNAIKSNHTLHNPQRLVIHRRSVVAFLQAGPGTAFTGIGRVGTAYKKAKGDAVRPKIFLCPAAQGTVSRANGEQGAYPVRPVPSNTETYVHKARVIGAIEHRKTQLDVSPDKTVVRIVPGTADARPMSSHDHLANAIKLKADYAAVSQMDMLGMFIGFTVCKGDPLRENAQNRYATTSASTNEGTFGRSAGFKPDAYDKYLPQEWLSQIMRVCDTLLELEENLVSTGWPVQEFCRDVLDEHLGKETWRWVVRTYWSIPESDAADDE